MFSQFSLSLPWLRFLGSKPEAGIDIPPVVPHDIETAQEKPGRALKHLLKLNHVTYSILYNGGKFHNHMPHLLSSAYLLGGGSKHLNRLYEEEAKDLEQWTDSPGEISRDDWREFLGKTEYQRAYVDFFEDELVRYRYDWKKVVEEYLYSGAQPLINSVVSGLGHPLIHLGYAYEMSSREVAMEALAMAATCYGHIHKFLDDPASSEATPSFQALSLVEILDRIRKDKRLDGIFKAPGGDNLDILFLHHEALILDYWRAWCITDPVEQFRESQAVATAVFVTTGGNTHDFFLVHLLTTSHAVRILLPLIPAKYHLPLVRQWWLIVVAIYIAQLRPQILLGSVNEHDLEGRDWSWVSTEARDGKWAASAHYIKPIRAMMEAAKTWGDPDEFYLKAAVKFIDEFQGWGGFGS